MLPTPSTSHVSFSTIYEPAEDSFLLLDTLSSPSEIKWLASRFHPAAHFPAPLVLEVGTGSGVVIAFLAANAREIFGRDVLAMGVDVNEDACGATAVTVRKALGETGSGSVFLGSVCADLLGAIGSEVVDVLLFNPPYVPTAELPVLPQRDQMVEDRYRHESRLLELSYAGGVDGMETTLRLLVELPRVLSERGVAYVLLCAQNKPEEVKKAIPMLLTGEWVVDTVGDSGRKAGWEKLVIIRIARSQRKFVSFISLIARTLLIS
jgi:release factor glutamine methyltransferase